MNEKHDKLIELMIRNRTARIAIVVPSHYWFFHFYFHKQLNYPTADFQKEMLRMTEDDNIKNLIIAGFRGSSKSTIITISYAIWSILGRQQKKFVLIVGQTAEKAQEHLGNIKRQFEENTLLGQDRGPFREIRNQWGAESLILPRYGARIAARSIGQSGVRGILFNGHRPDVVIMDDIESIESVRSKDTRDKIEEWITNELLPAGDRDTRFFLLGTPLHPDSFFMRLKRAVEENRFAGVFRSYPFFDETGAPLWPGKFSDPKAIEAMRKTIPNEIAWRLEYLLETAIKEIQIVHPDWIQYYDFIPKEIESQYRYTIISIDPAVSEDEAAACTAMVAAHIYGYGEDTEIYILPTMVNEHLSYEDAKEKAKLLSRTLGKGSWARIVVEDVGAQSYYPQDLANASYPAKGVRPRGNKKDRLIIAAGPVQAKKVHFPRNAEKLVDQLVWFDPRGYNDLADAFSQLIIEVMNGERLDGFSEYIKKYPDGPYGPPNNPGLPRSLSEWKRLTDNQRSRDDFGGF
ncbi:MAG: hypothetical protein Q8R55_00345 [Candidatus Taylorbacteria bacterium]|nr:hypothetical protein [Candidatus Taylorbacteria bacterium]